MTNKKVEELVREKYCLSNYDDVKVEFLMSDSFTEEYRVTDIITVDGNDFRRVSIVVVTTLTEEVTFKVIKAVALSWKL